MKKLQIQICLVSARGLRRTPSFWKLHWYAVAWIHPQHKYCTKIDASGSGNPLWNTTFSTTIDPSDDANLLNSVLHVEVYSREPVFLRESLFGSATVVLKEFLEKYESKSESAAAAAAEEIGSFQLRKKKSDRAAGFVDVSIRISEDPETASYLGPEEGFVLRDPVTRTANPGSLHPTELHPLPPYHHQFGGANHYAAPGASYQPHPPPPPPPPGSIGYGPYIGPATPADYISMPSSVAPPGHGAGPRPGFGMGVAAGGALAAGAMIYGEDLLSGFRAPSASWDGSVSVSAYPPF